VAEYDYSESSKQPMRNAFHAAPAFRLDQGPLLDAFSPTQAGGRFA
jgi:hypothetical protein